MLFDTKNGDFYFQDKSYNFTDRRWEAATHIPESVIELSLQDAVKKLQNSPDKIKQPIGIVGAGQPTEKQYRMAEDIGKILASLKLSIICGGRGGIMEAVCKGVYEIGGASIGILPEGDLSKANPYVTIPIATGLGLARNSIIANGALCLLAIGGGNGTLSEIAYGLQLNKKVFAIDCTLQVNNMITCADIDDAINEICQTVFSFP